MFLEKPGFCDREMLINKVAIDETPTGRSIKQGINDMHLTLRDANTEIEKIKGKLYAMAYSHIGSTSEDILRLVSDLDKSQSTIRRCSDNMSELSRNIENSTYVIAPKYGDCGGVG